MIGKLPALRDPVRYAGLYIFDFGDHVSVGYTAEEIEYLLDESRYTSGTVYKIQRAHPDGTLEIRGVDPSGWSRTTGIVFWFADDLHAKRAYDDLLAATARWQAPGVIDVVLCRRSGREFNWAIVLRYLQELDEAVSSWLLAIDYQAGLIIEAGAGPVQEAIATADVLEEQELQPAETYRPRNRDEVLASVQYAVQR